MMEHFILFDFDEDKNYQIKERKKLFPNNRCSHREILISTATCFIIILSQGISLLLQLTWVQPTIKTNLY